MSIQPTQPTGNTPKHIKKVLMAFALLVTVLAVVFVIRQGNKAQRQRATATVPKTSANSTLLPESDVTDFQNNIEHTAAARPTGSAARSHVSPDMYPTAPHARTSPMQAHYAPPRGTALPYSASVSSSVPPMASYSAQPAAPSYQSASGSSTPSTTSLLKKQKILFREDELKREYFGRFASNVAYRVPAQPTSKLKTAVGTGFQGAPAPNASPTPPAPMRPTSARHTPPSSVTQGGFLIPEGTLLDTVLLTRLNGDFSGPVECMVSEPLYDRSHQIVLIPAGSKVLGDTHSVNSIGQQRLAVTFHRILRPDGYSINLDTFTGLDQIGETALHDKVNHHYLQIFGVSIALGLVSGWSSSTVNSTNTYPSGLSQYKQGFSQSVSQSSTQILDRYLNIMPTIIIREGTRVKIYFTQDVRVPAAQLHPILD